MSGAAAGASDMVMSLTEAVRLHVRPGRSIYIGNFGAQLYCVGHEIIRQRLRDLDAVIASGGLLLDQLIGAGVLRSASFGHCWSPVGPSPAWNFRRQAEGGYPGLAISEMSLGMMTAALTAGAWGVPFMPVPALVGTGFLDEDWTRGHIDAVASRFGEATVVEALSPDIAFIHADLVDPDGNAVIRGPLGEVLVAAQAATTVVVVAEELASREAVREAGISVPGLLVSSVVVQPGALHPDGAIGRYARDVEAYQRYVAAAATVEGFDRWLDSVRDPRRPEASDLDTKLQEEGR